MGGGHRCPLCGPGRSGVGARRRGGAGGRRSRAGRWCRGRAGRPPSTRRSVPLM
ncbi:hypothetical protein SBD_6560 [Streptomyces bottropensis ATCC 25435]|uniref:Uncharacterized protein n=1 Tax=Streptomyces bottropensis ATCC 25435 TaxID=1054862 RepID=M3FJ19_9ACTN|nr:hypothetical protein SBD_6560 [Streptomyces bottropensis ATCC 25435]